MKIRRAMPYDPVDYLQARVLITHYLLENPTRKLIPVILIRKNTLNFWGFLSNQ